MMAELLRYIHTGGRTLAQIAREMGIERDELHSRVHMLERSGYIKETSTASIDCTSRCGNCPVASTCHDEGSHPNYLVLTEKGLKYLKTRK
jgi:hypothetical protein